MGKAKSNHRVISCQAEAHYHLWLRFADGMEGSIDLRSLIVGGIGAFKMLRDEREFRNVQPINGTVIWDAGVRLDSTVLHDDIAARGPQTKAHQQPSMIECGPNVVAVRQGEHTVWCRTDDERQGRTSEPAFQRFMQAALTAATKPRRRRKP